MINPLTGGLEFVRAEKNLKENSGFSDVNENFCPVMSFLPIEEKLKLVKEVGEEIINEDELKKLFETKKMPVCYDGLNQVDVCTLLKVFSELSMSTD